MNTALVIVAVLAALGTLWAFSAGARAGRGIERQMRWVSRTGQVAALSVVLGAVLTAIQWSVLTRVPNPSLATVTLVLGVPGVLAGATLARIFEMDMTIHGRGPRRSARRRGVRR